MCLYISNEKYDIYKIVLVMQNNSTGLDTGLSADFSVPLCLISFVFVCLLTGKLRENGVLAFSCKTTTHNCVHLVSAYCLCDPLDTPT